MIVFVVAMTGGIILDINLHNFWTIIAKILILTISYIAFYLAIRPKKIFLISPVRNAPDNPCQMEKIRFYVENLEKRGVRVHWPIRDTNQNDSIGIRICRDNMIAMLTADEIHIWYFENGGFKQSTGSLFDFGIAFFLHYLWGTKIKLVNPEAVPQTNHKSYENVLLKISGHY